MAAAAPELAAAVPRRPGFHRVAAAVAAGGLVITVVLVLATAWASRRGEARLLSLQTRLVAAALTAEPLFVEDHLGGAARLAAVTNGNAATFRQAVSGSVSRKGPFVLASLWRANGSPRLLARAGATPLAGPASPSSMALIRQAAASKTFVVTKVSGPHALRLAYAIAAAGPGGRFVAYAEAPLPASRRFSQQPSSPAAQLNIAIYLGPRPVGPALLAADSAAALPLRGTTFTSRVKFGNSVLTLVTSARSPLAGPVSQVLPWAMASGGLVLTALAALLTERLVRRRERAEQLSGQLNQLYVEQRSVAETLQRALLPQAVPAIPGMEIAVRYLAAARGTEIGGDWYDVIPLPDGRFAFVVGDVSGHGVRAAAVMASLHYASRAYALEGHPPAAILAGLARMLNVAQDGHFATVLCGLVDVAAHTVVLASAGHLPPVVREGAETSVAGAAPGPPIGVSEQASYAPATVTVAVHGMLIAYTDGLIERRGESLDVGMKRLQEAASRESPTLKGLLDSIVAGLTGDAPRDDVALIGLRWRN